MSSTRNVLLGTAVACIALIGGALYMQHYKDMLPCPYCVIQRYLFLAVAFFCLVGASMANPRPGALLGMLAAMGGAGVAARHVWIVAHPGLSCGIDPLETMLNKIWPATYLPMLFRADGLCEDALAPLLGLSLPQWSCVWFGMFTLALAWVVVKRR